MNRILSSVVAIAITASTGIALAPASNANTAPVPSVNVVVDTPQPTRTVNGRTFKTSYPVGSPIMATASVTNAPANTVLSLSLDGVVIASAPVSGGGTVTGTVVPTGNQSPMWDAMLTRNGVPITFRGTPIQVGVGAPRATWADIMIPDAPSVGGSYAVGSTINPRAFVTNAPAGSVVTLTASTGQTASSPVGVGGTAYVSLPTVLGAAGNYTFTLAVSGTSVAKAYTVAAS